MKIFRYNANNYRTVEAKIDSNWKVSVHESDPNTVINCIHCGQPIKFSDSQESKRYKNETDRSYRECLTCYNNYLTVIRSNNNN